MTLLSWLFFLLSFFYVSLILYHLMGWLSTPTWRQDDALSSIYPDRKNSAGSTNPLTELVEGNGWKSVELPSCSIIIPARNEAEHIIPCLEAIFSQDYKGGFEVIVVDDHSDDRTADLVEHHIGKLWTAGNTRLRLLRMGGGEGEKPAYKKQAITKGIELASGEVILTTDADCRRGNRWLSMMMGFMQAKGLYLVSGPVELASHSMFEKMQALEFAGLVGIGGAALRMGTPNMCNGANLAYHKKVFYEVGGYSGNEHLGSGDDEFLMHKVFGKYPSKVSFLKNRQALVTAEPQHELSGFMQQRKRWVSKSMHYNARLITVLMALVYLYNLGIACSFFLGLSNGWWLRLFLWQIGFKMAAEGIFLWQVLRAFDRRKLLVYLLPAQVLHIGYVLFIGIAGNISTYKWKGRELK